MSAVDVPQKCGHSPSRGLRDSSYENDILRFETPAKLFFVSGELMPTFMIVEHIIFQLQIGFDRDLRRVVLQCQQCAATT